MSEAKNDPFSYHVRSVARVQRQRESTCPEGLLATVSRLQAGDAGVRIEDRGADGVYIVEVPQDRYGSSLSPDGKPRPLAKPDVIATRVDSRQDNEYRRAGRVIWFDALLAAAKAKTK